MMQALISTRTASHLESFQQNYFINALTEKISLAIANPETAIISEFLDSLEEACQALNTRNQLYFGGKIIEQLAHIIELKSQSLDELKPNQSNEIIGLGKEILGELLQISVSAEISLKSISEDLLDELPIKDNAKNLDPYLWYGYNSKKILASVWLDELEIPQVRQDYEENFDIWIALISQFLANNPNTNFDRLLQQTKLGFSQAFLGILHGEFQLEQETFYNAATLLICKN